MYRKELATARSFDEMPGQRAPRILVFDLISRFILSITKSGLDRVCTFRLLLLVSFAPRGFCAVHMHALRLLYIRVRCVQAGPRMPLCYPMVYPHMRSPCLLGYFLSNLHILLYRYPSCTPIWYLSERQSYYGCCCTIAVLGIELIVEH
jgi:hypothetical protein